MQHLLTPGPLLDEKGNLCEAGYAFSLVKKYDRKAISRRQRLRIKEWDYYYLGNDEYGIALTIDDNSYMSLGSISLLDFKNKSETTRSVMGFFSNGKIGFPSDSKEGNLFYKTSKTDLRFLHEGEKRHLICSMKDFKDGKDFSCDLMVEENNKDTMVIATPFKKKGHFYYNQKNNDLSASGSFSLGDQKHEVKDCYGVLDWGRGVWTYKNTWYWASMSSFYQGHFIGFNLGYGFGNTEAASENMFFYDGKGYKLEDVKFSIPHKDKKDLFMEEWEFSSSSGDIQMTFKPLIDRKAVTDLGLIGSNQNQVFGLYSGSFCIGEQTVQFKDVIGFAEKVFNKW